MGELFRNLPRGGYRAGMTPHPTPWKCRSKASEKDCCTKSGLAAATNTGRLLVASVGGPAGYRTRTMDVRRLPGELAALQAVYDSALASDRAMERLLEDIRRCSDTKVHETLILWLDRQIDEASCP